MLQNDSLKNVQLLSEFGNDELEELLKITKEKEFIEGDMVFCEGDESTELYILIKGEIEIQIKLAPQLAESTVYVVKPSDVFGEFAFIDLRPRSASARCTKNTTLAIIKRDDFDKLIKKTPDIGLKFYRNLSQLLTDRLRRMNIYLKDAYIRSLGMESKG